MLQSREILCWLNLFDQIDINMKLNKTSQKIDNSITKALTHACQLSLKEVAGFLWLTHRVNFTNFPASLVITCVFSNEVEISDMKLQQHDELLRVTIQKHLLKVGVVVKNISKQVRFDSEEACLREHNGEWPERLQLNIAKQKSNPKGYTKPRG